MIEAPDERRARERREDAARLLRAHLLMQDGVASHAQLTAGGVTKTDIERRLRRKELRRVYPRIYVDHAGPMTWS